MIILWNMHKMNKKYYYYYHYYNIISKDRKMKQIDFLTAPRMSCDSQGSSSSIPSCKKDFVQQK